MDSAVHPLRWQFRVIHELLDSWAAVAPQRLPRYAERVVVEDVIVSGVLGGCAPLALSTWRGRTGLSRLPPLDVQCRRDGGWVDTVQINEAVLRNYAHAVYASTDAYLVGVEPTSDRLTLCVLTALLSPRRGPGRHLSPRGNRRSPEAASASAQLPP